MVREPGPKARLFLLFMDMEHALRNHIRRNLIEFLSLADKVYYRTNKLPPLYQQYINRITGGDAWTKLVADMVYAVAQQNQFQGSWAVSIVSDEPEHERQDEYEVHEGSLNKDDWMNIKYRYEALKNYNKNTLPIKGLDPKGVEDVWGLYRALKSRQQILEQLAKLPKVAIRNLRADLRVPRDAKELRDYAHTTEYAVNHISLLNNRDESSRKQVYKKLFRSNLTMDQLVNMVEDKESLLGGYEIDRNEVQKMIARTGGDLELIYDQGDYMVLKVHGPEGIQEIGCNSLWCFTYSRDGALNFNDWYNYSTNDVVYVMIDFSSTSDSSDFMYVLVKPVTWEHDGSDEEVNDEKLFSMDNVAHYDPINVFSSTIGLETAKRLLDFDEEEE